MFDELKKALGLEPEEPFSLGRDAQPDRAKLEDIGLAPPPASASTQRALAFAKDQGVGEKRPPPTREEILGFIDQVAKKNGAPSRIPPPPAPPPETSDDKTARYSESGYAPSKPRDYEGESRRVIEGAATAGRVATDQFPPKPSIMEQAQRGVDRLRAKGPVEQEPGLDFTKAMPQSGGALKEEGNPMGYVGQYNHDDYTEVGPGRYVAKGNQSVEPGASVEDPRLASFDPAHEALNRGHGTTPEEQGSVDSQKQTTEPPGKRRNDTGRADLLLAINKAAQPPEAQQEAPAPAPGQQPPNVTPPGEQLRRPLGLTGPLPAARPNSAPPPPPDEATFQAQLHDPNRRIFDFGQGGGQMAPRMAGQMAMGGSDEGNLRNALAESSRLKQQAAAIDSMGMGADIAAGTHFHHGEGGNGLRAQAEGLVEQATQPREFGLKTRKQEEDLVDQLQNRGFKSNAEGRAQSAEQRAQAEEGRKVTAEGRAAKKFQGEEELDDPNSATSAQARDAVEAIYPGIRKKLPHFDSMTSNDVKRVFGEVSLKEQNQALGARGGAADRFAEKQVQDYNKNRITDRTLESVNNLMGRLEDKTPISGFDAAKGWAKAEKIPLLGGMLSGAGNSAVRGTEMEGIAQDAMTVMQQISLDTSGKVLNETEMRHIEERLGLATGQGEDAFRRAMKREFDAIQAKADRDYESLSPDARDKVDRRNLRPVFKAVPRDKTGYAPSNITPGDARAADTKGTLGAAYDTIKGWF